MPDVQIGSALAGREILGLPGILLIQKTGRIVVINGQVTHCKQWFQLIHGPQNNMEEHGTRQELKLVKPSDSEKCQSEPEDAEDQPYSKCFSVLVGLPLLSSVYSSWQSDNKQIIV